MLYLSPSTSLWSLPLTFIVESVTPPDDRLGAMPVEYKAGSPAMVGKIWRAGAQKIRMEGSLVHNFCVARCLRCRYQEGNGWEGSGASMGYPMGTEGARIGWRRGGDAVRCVGQWDGATRAPGGWRGGCQLAVRKRRWRYGHR